MTQENVIHLNNEISNHFRLLKRVTYLAGTIMLAILIPMVGLVWSMNVSLIQLEHKAELLDLNKMEQTEVYDNFVNKGQYIYLEGERLKCIQDVTDGVEMARIMKEWGKQVKDALDIRYRGVEKTLPFKK